MAVFQAAQVNNNEPADQCPDDRRLQNELISDVLASAKSIAGPGASPLVESLAKTVALFEHDLRRLQTVNAQRDRDTEGQRSLDRATRRYLSACRTLALVRKLSLPGIQINVAENQIVNP